MNYNKGKRYSEEYKLNAIKVMSEKNKSVMQISYELKINVMTLYKWQKEYIKYVSDLSKNGELEKEIAMLRYKLNLMEKKCESLKNTCIMLSKRNFS